MSDMQRDLTRGHGPGHWTPVLLESDDDAPAWRAVVWCPACGKPMGLQRGHTIAADGSVSPSVGHPDAYGETGKACPWHLHPRLVGWDNPVAPPARPFTTCARCHRQSRFVGGWGTDGRYDGTVCDTCKKELADASPSPTETST